MNVSTDIHDPQRNNPTDFSHFSSGTSTRLAFAILKEMSSKLLDASAWNFGHVSLRMNCQNVTSSVTTRLKKKKKYPCINILGMQKSWVRISNSNFKKSLHTLGLNTSLCKHHIAWMKSLNKLKKETWYCKTVWIEMKFPTLELFKGERFIQ